MQDQQPTTQPETAPPESPPSEEAAAAAAVTEEPKNRTERRIAKREMLRDKVEIQALRQIVAQLNATAQLSVATLSALLSREIEVQKIEGKDAALLIVWCQPGKELNDAVANEIMKLLNMPLVILPKDMLLRDASVEALEKAGWTKVPPKLALAPEETKAP